MQHTLRDMARTDCCDKPRVHYIKFYDSGGSKNFPILTPRIFEVYRAMSSLPAKFLEKSV